MTLRKGEGALDWKRKHQIAVRGELALEAAVDLRNEWCCNFYQDESLLFSVTLFYLATWIKLYSYRFAWQQKEQCWHFCSFPWYWSPHVLLQRTTVSIKLYSPYLQTLRIASCGSHAHTHTHHTWQLNTSEFHKCGDRKWTATDAR